MLFLDFLRKREKKTQNTKYGFTDSGRTLIKAI